MIFFASNPVFIGAMVAYRKNIDLIVWPLNMMGFIFCDVKKRVQQKEQKKMLVLIARDGRKVIAGREWLSALSYQLISKSKQKSVNVIEIETKHPNWMIDQSECRRWNDWMNQKEVWWFVSQR